jgi:hypothetical protein
MPHNGYVEKQLKPSDGNSWGDSLSLYTAWVICAVLLVLAVTGEGTRSFYIALRWICCAVFLLTSIAFSRRAHKGMIFVLALLTVAFNPILPLDMSRGKWLAVDGFSLFLLFAFISGRFDSEKRTKLKERKQRWLEMAAKVTADGDVGWHWNGYEWIVAERVPYTPDQQQEVALRISEHSYYMADLPAEWANDFAKLTPPEREEEYNQKLEYDQRKKRRLRGLRPFVSRLRYVWEGGKQYLVMGAAIAVVIALVRCGNQNA